MHGAKHPRVNPPIPALMARIPDKQAVFLELDGVLCEHPRLDVEGRVTWLPGALDALQRIDPATFKIFIATNREDIAMGRLREREFKKFCDRFIQDTRDAEIEIQKIYSCPYHPKGRQRYRKESVFRKPAPGMFKMAQQEFDLNLARCWMIGHRSTDVLAASRAGMGTILVETGEAGRDGEFIVDPHFTEPDIAHAVLRIQSFEAALRC